jgi:hypothetical protein
MNAHVVNLESNLKPGETAGEEITVGNDVVTAAALGGRDTHAELSVKANPVRYTTDGTDPVSSGAGSILVANERVIWRREKLSAAKFVASTAGSGAVIRIESLVE